MIFRDKHLQELLERGIKKQNVNKETKCKL